MYSKKRELFQSPSNTPKFRNIISISQINEDNARSPTSRHMNRKYAKLDEKCSP